MRTSDRSAGRLKRPRHDPGEARNIIVAAAVRFLSRRPFRDLSVGNLMSETPLSRPAFYQYFRDRHDLMETLLGVVKERIRAEANPWLTGEDEPEALRESLRGVVAVGVELGAVLRAVSEAAPFDQRLQRSWRRFLSYWDDAVTTRIGAQQATGKIDCFDAGAIAKALNALDVAVLVQAFGRKPHADPEAVLDTLHRIWVGAIYARLGPACQS